MEYRGACWLYDISLTLHPDNATEVQYSAGFEVGYTPRGIAPADRRANHYSRGDGVSMGGHGGELVEVDFVKCGVMIRINHSFRIASVPVWRLWFPAYVAAAFGWRGGVPYMWTTLTYFVDVTGEASATFRGSVLPSQHYCHNLHTAAGIDERFAEQDMLYPSATPLELPDIAKDMWGAMTAGMRRQAQPDRRPETVL